MDTQKVDQGTVTVRRNVQAYITAMAADVPDGACGEVPAGRTSWLMLARAF